MPAERNPRASRERTANPPAGTAPAPPSGMPPEGALDERDQAHVTETETNVKGAVPQSRTIAVARFIAHRIWFGEWKETAMHASTVHSSDTDHNGWNCAVLFAGDTFD